MSAIGHWLLARLGEKTSQAALATAILATATVASEPQSYSASGLVSWLELIPVWAGSLITICLPEVGTVSRMASVAVVQPAPIASPAAVENPTQPTGAPS
jgi:hypothetical protein